MLALALLVACTPAPCTPPPDGVAAASKWFDDTGYVELDVLSDGTATLIYSCGFGTADAVLVSGGAIDWTFSGFPSWDSALNSPPRSAELRGQICADEISGTVKDDWGTEPVHLTHHNPDTGTACPA